DLSGQTVLGRTSTARHVRQPGYAVVLIAMQPVPHHALPTVMDLGDLRHPVAPPGPQHNVRAQRHPTHRLAADSLDLVPLLLRQVDAHHDSSNRLPLPAR